jgi:hypothetical protein
MQLTRFDRWLREKVAYETHIQTLRLPESIPSSIKIKIMDIPEAPGRRYKHLIIARRAKDADKIINILRDNGQMYATQIIDRKGLIVRLLAPKEKSLTWWLFSTTVICIFVLAALIYIKSLIDDPEFMKNFMEALQIMKG